MTAAAAAAASRDRKLAASVQRQEAVMLTCRVAVEAAELPGELQVMAV